MRVRLTLKPGQRGTKQFVEEYGDRLVCVRYRYDDKLRKRYKTVELIVDEADWPDQHAPMDALVVGVLVAREETDRSGRSGNCGTTGSSAWNLKGAWCGTRRATTRSSRTA
jgi:hypothetical protein